MKKRVFVDGALLQAGLIFTGVLYACRDIFPQGLMLDNVLDFIGMICILKGILMRGSSRAFKKQSSMQGGTLVTTGPYGITRNPMYFGTFVCGLGFVLIAWPWWMVPVYIGFFYLRFNNTMVKEEKLLSEQFGDEYKKYCAKVARFFPRGLKKLKKVKAYEIYNLDLAFRTKEARALCYLPLLAVVLEVLQQYFVFGFIDLIEVALIFLTAFVTLFMSIALSYQE
ncbi:MAG: protein-S-isoprenylcysteine O-methyltransferase Ste14 [Lysobacterales bacterium]|jgi:protein-S-isoprenylcysteine O-methyltransferase Ste14